MAGKREQQMKEITERLEQGVKELFTSEMYTEYLKTMSQFHNYSFNNTLLIAMQRPDATLVAGYQAWQKKFKRQVKKGEKGIQIIAPAPIREKEEIEKFDPETNELILRPDGQPETEEVVHTIPRFRIATVFDVSQTYGEPLPELETPELMGSVENYEVFMQALREISPVPIRFDEIESGAKGFYSNANKEIVIQQGMSESQTMKTGIHETAHAKLHDREIMEELGEKKNQMTREVEAESVAYTVCQYFGLDTSDYSFPYIAGWSSSIEMKELRDSMDTIRKTAGKFIDQMVEKFHEIQRQKAEERDIQMDDLILCISGSMGSEYGYYVVENMTAGQLEESVRDYVRLVDADAFLENDVSLEEYLTERGAGILPVYASDGLGEEYPIDFFDVEYDADTGVTVFSELSAQRQAEMLIAKAEYKRTIFRDDEKDLITNYAYKFDNAQRTRALLEAVMQAHDSDAGEVFQIMEVAQEEIDFLPDGMTGFSEMHRYGYRSDDVMLPLGKNRAYELYQEGVEILALHSDNTESVVDAKMEIDAHEGLFGVEREQWEKYLAAEESRELSYESREYQKVEFFDVPALLANERVSVETLPEGIYRYELRGSDNDPGYPVTVENHVAVNHAATILTVFPLYLPEEGWLWIGEELNFTGGDMTVREYQQAIADRNRTVEQEKAENAIGRANEELYLAGKEDRYAIYQIAKATEGRDYRFMGLDFVTSHDMKVNAAHYGYVHGGRLFGGETLESLYETFNLNHPEGYTGHSLSVSDVVVLQKEGKATAYYVDSFGFQELPDFVQERLHEAEMDRKRWYAPVTLDTSGIEIEQHEGLWHAVDKREVGDEIFYLMKHNEYGDSVAAVMVGSDGDLVAQELENGFDRGAMEGVKEYLAEKGIAWEPGEQERKEWGIDGTEGTEKTVREITSEQKAYPPLYPFNLAYAMEHAAVDEYLDSRKLNIDCKNAVEEAIRTHFDGLHLADGAVEPVLEEYGKERLAFVLACTVQNNLSDGRFSRDNKAWAESIPVLENISKRTDANLDYVVNSHPAVLDGYIRIAREKFAEQQLLEEYQGNYDKEAAYWLRSSEKYLFLQTATDGYDYTFYDKEYRELDGGVYDDSNLTFREALEEILADEGQSNIDDCEVIDCENFLDLVDRAEYFPQKSFEALKDLMNSGEDKIAFKSGYGYVSIQKVEDGYNSVVYDSDWKEIGGDFYDTPDASMEEAVGWVFKDKGLGDLECKPFSYDELEKSVLRAAKERPKDNRRTPTSQISMRETSLNGQCRHDIEETVLCFAQAQLEEMEISEEVRLLGARVYGSRTREGLYHNDSDVDVVLSYTGNIREDDFFHILHEDGMKIAGILVDMNPISVEQTGTLEMFMENAEKYLDDKELQKLASDIDEFSEDYDPYEYKDTVLDKEENVRQIYTNLVSGKAEPIREWVAGIAAKENDDLPEVVQDAKNLLARIEQAQEKGRADIKGQQEEVEPVITFYMAECSEFPILGEYHERLTLQEAAEFYQKIPADRINGLKEIGFRLEDGSIYDGNFGLMTAGKMQTEFINEIPKYRDSPLVQKAIADMEGILSEWREKEQQKEVPEDTRHREGAERSGQTEEMVSEPLKQPEKAPEKDNSVPDGTGRKQSVLKALRERQAKLKEQEQNNTEQKAQKRKKGEHEL